MSLLLLITFSFCCRLSTSATLQTRVCSWLHIEVIQRVPYAYQSNCYTHIGPWFTNTTIYHSEGIKPSSSSVPKVSNHPVTTSQLYNFLSCQEGLYIALHLYDQPFSRITRQHSTCEVVETTSSLGRGPRW